jgi:hypothetical protein
LGWLLYSFIHIPWWWYSAIAGLVIAWLIANR